MRSAILTSTDILAKIPHPRPTCPLPPGLLWSGIRHMKPVDSRILSMTTRTCGNVHPPNSTLALGAESWLFVDAFLSRRNTCPSTLRCATNRVFGDHETANCHPRPCDLGDGSGPHCGSATCIPSPSWRRYPAKPETRMVHSPVTWPLPGGPPRAFQRGASGLQSRLPLPIQDLNLRSQRPHRLVGLHARATP